LLFSRKAPREEAEKLNKGSMRWGGWRDDEAGLETVVKAYFSELFKAEAQGGCWALYYTRGKWNSVQGVYWRWNL